jgi:hypothetical protein
MENDFLNPQSLQHAILMKVSGGQTFVEAMLEFCDDADIEYEDIVDLITDNLKQRIREEYVDSGYLKPEACLNI